MQNKRIILLYLIVFIIVITVHPTVSFPYSPSVESLTEYIIDLSRDIYGSLQRPDESILTNSKGELKVKLLLSPWGELKDAYISESSGNEKLDSLCLNAVRLYERYQPFPEELGESDRWIDVPIIFETKDYGMDLDIRIRKYTPEVSTQVRLPDSIGIEDAVDIASENDIGARIAKKEIELSEIKIREATRALYPAASLNYLETTGMTTTSVQDFTDKEYKVKFEYPLYYGWRLRYAVEQGIANMKASRYNYNKVLQDLKIDVETAYYSYLVSISNSRIQDSLLGVAQDISEKERKRFEAGLTTRAEFLQVASQLKQITYQVASSNNELEMAELSLAQAMNLDDEEYLKDLIATRIDLMDLEEVLDINVELDECLELAFKNRPDLRSKEYMVEFNDYERKIAMAKDQLKVDLTGTYGKSGGAFQSETLTLATDWYFGIKVSKPLGGNTVSTSYTKEETSQKHGVSSRTESVSKAVEIGLLDNLKSLSEAKTAEVALEKSKEELEKVKESTVKEVRESYLDYKKGLVQIKVNLNKIRQKEEELKVSKARAELNEIPFSELLQAHMSLADEKTFYIETLGSLYQSLAKLNKATGYALFLDSENFMLAQKP